MHKRRLSEWTLTMVIKADGPLLIKAGGDAGADPTLPDMYFVRTRHPVSGEQTIYLPGSSLKGAIRSHVERIIRTVHGGHDWICCDPLHRRESCGRKIDTRKVSDTAAQYQALCLACRIFGQTTQASHFYISDAYPAEAINQLSVRHQVAIDRLSGGVAVGPFELEAALSEEFEVTLTLLNAELWQIGLLALALRDMAEGRLLLGYGKSRGLGQVKLTLGRLAVAYPGRFQADNLTNRLSGVGALAADMVADYGFVANDMVNLSAEGQLIDGSAAWGRPEIRFGHAGDEPLLAVPEAERATAHRAIMAILGQVVPTWAAYVPQKGAARE
ncbi:MAG: RAMP superfamily CRISPR-associated protein [Chloroflexota bacterium]